MTEFTIKINFLHELSFVPLSTCLSSSLGEHILKEYMLNLQKSENPLNYGQLRDLIFPLSLGWLQGTPNQFLINHPITNYIDPSFYIV